MRKDIWYGLVTLILVVCVSFLGGLAGGSTVAKTLETFQKVEIATADSSIELEEAILLSEWEMLQMAIAKTESDFKPEARGGEAAGILQITPIMVREVNRLLEDSVYTYKDRFDVEKSLEIFATIQGVYNKDSLSVKAIKVWNPGGESIGYSKKVMNNLEFIRRYERVRQALMSKRGN